MVGLLGVHEGVNTDQMRKTQRLESNISGTNMSGFTLTHSHAFIHLKLSQVFCRFLLWVHIQKPTVSYMEPGTNRV